MTVNKLKGPKHFWNLHERVFITFSDHTGGKWFWKFLPYSTLKSKGCLLAHWLQIKSILLRIVRICRSLFKCNFLKKEKHFLSFFFHLWNLHQVLNIFKKRKIVRANLFPKLQTVKDLVRPLSKKRRFRRSFDNQHVKGSQTLVTSPLENFYRIFSSRSGNWFGKYLPYRSLKSWGCLLTHWLSITSILSQIVRICGSLFKWCYLKKANLFPSFLFHLWNLHRILNILKKIISS